MLPTHSFAGIHFTRKHWTVLLMCVW